MSAKLRCTLENAPLFSKWLKERGGIAVWRSIDLSDPGLTWSTPALDKNGNPSTKPSSRSATKPEHIITNANEVEVCFDREVKRFHVGTRMSGNGLSLKVTDGGSRRIRREVENAGEGAYHLFDDSDYANAVIMAPEKTEPLDRWEHYYLKGEDDGERKSYGDERGGLSADRESNK